MSAEPSSCAPLPYRVAVLCYLYDDLGRVLLLHRNKNPNAGMHSPIGGKLELDEGESPHACAHREIIEEAGLQLDDGDLRLTGIVSETAYEGQTHWLIFLFEAMRPIAPQEIPAMSIEEGQLQWVPVDRVLELEIPYTDRHIMWPLVRAHRGGFFMVDIDCRGAEVRWQVRESDRSA